MNLSITLTGADDSVSPADLAKLSERYPYVEWGILLSAKRKGEPRYPSWSWITELSRAAAGRRVALSAHLCGDDARRFFSGDDLWLSSEWSHGFKRIQLNGYSTTSPAADLYIVKSAVTHPDLTFILQISNSAALERAIQIAHVVRNVEALFDLSGGRGIPLTEFPPMPGNLRMGYAGGIGLHNLEDVLGKLRHMEPAFADTWVDMESSLRAGDKGERFDLGRCEEVLKQAQHFMVKKVQLSSLYGKFAQG
jgi:hypothetical protein